MVHKLTRCLVVALVGLFVMSTLALAVGNMVSGTVQKVDTQKGRVTLQAEDGKTVELQAPAALLAGLQAGDAVEVKMSGKRATEIHKKGEMQSPGRGGQWKQIQPPSKGGTPRSQ